MAKSSFTANFSKTSAINTSAWLILSSSLLFVLTILIVTAQQISYDRRQAIAAAIHQNENRADGFLVYVIRTLELAHGQILAGINSSKTLAIPNGGIVVVPLTAEVPGFVALTIGSRGAHDRQLKTGIANLPVLPAREYERANANTNLAVSEPLRTSDGREYIGLTERFRTEKGRALYATLWVEPRVFTDFAEPIAFAPTDLISIIGLDGISRSRRTGDVKSAGENLRGTLVMSQQFKNPNGTYLGPSSIDGIARIFSHRRVPGQPLFVTSGVSFSGSLQQFRQHRVIYIFYFAIGALASIIAAWMLLRGIGARQRQIAALEAANQRLNEAQKIGLIGSWDYDFRTDRMYWSENLSAMYQRSEGASRTTIADAIHYAGSSADQVTRSLESVRRTGQPSEYELGLMMPDGQHSVRKVVMVPIFDRRGEVIGIRGTDQDITARKNVESLEARVAHLAQIDAMNAIAATLAHELNQPLAATANYAGAAVNLLSGKGPINEGKLKNLLERAIAQIHHCGDIIRGARDLVAREKSEIRSSRLSRLLGKSVDMLEGVPRFHPEIVSYTVEAEADHVLARPAQIKQVFVNLIRNAIEATPVDRHPSIVVSAKPLDARFIVVSIQDNGSGFDDPAIDRFSALSISKTGGLGIGLSLCRTIIEGHGGSIWITSSGKDGTTVCFTLLASITSDPA